MSYKNFLAKYPISDGWGDHIARGSAGGIDYAVPVGTPIPAPTDGRLENTPNNGSAGNTATLWHADGSRDQFLHLSKFAAPGNYKQGDIIGWSGGKAGSPGAGSSTGPHIHWHYVLANGSRVNPLNYLSDAASPAPVVDGWLGLQKWLRLNYGYSGAADGIPGKLTWTAMQKFLKTNFGYKGALDGIPGPMTWSAVQRWLKQSYSYNGVVDGVPGPLTYAALTRAGADLAKR